MAIAALMPIESPAERVDFKRSYGIMVEEDCLLFIG